VSATAEPIQTAADPAEDIPDVPIYRLTVAQYHAMARAGILEDGAPVELLEGWLVPKMTKYPPHSVVTTLVRQALEHLLPAGWYVPSQEPFTATDSEPEPDLMVVRGTPREYLRRHPGPTDVALVIEVADTSIRRDRGPKKRVYGSAGIGIYWIVNLKARQIEIYTAPKRSVKRPGFHDRHDYGAEDMIPLVLDGSEVGRLSVRDLLP
jgi:Uma2 family endonuclease